MVLCHCRAVTDRAVRAAIESGAETLSDVARRCRAGTGCGGCCPALRDLLAEYGLDTEPSLSRLVGSAAR